MTRLPMVVVLSPAKTMDMSAGAERFLASEPRMLAQAAPLLCEMKRKDKPALKKMMGVSDAVADLNYKRFQAFDKACHGGIGQVMLTGDFANAAASALLHECFKHIKLGRCQTVRGHVGGEALLKIGHNFKQQAPER